jgi:hypothetical protein
MNEQEIRAKSLEIAAIIGQRRIGNTEIDDLFDTTASVINEFIDLAQKIEPYISQGLRPENGNSQKL